MSIDRFRAPREAKPPHKGPRIFPHTSLEQREEWIAERLKATLLDLKEQLLREVESVDGPERICEEIKTIVNQINHKLSRLKEKMLRSSANILSKVESTYGELKFLLMNVEERIKKIDSGYNSGESTVDVDDAEITRSFKEVAQEDFGEVSLDDNSNEQKPIELPHLADFTGQTVIRVLQTLGGHCHLQNRMPNKKRIEIPPSHHRIHPKHDHIVKRELSQQVQAQAEQEEPLELRRTDLKPALKPAAFPALRKAVKRARRQREKEQSLSRRTARQWRAK